MLILTAQDIRQALPMRAAIETQKRAYIAVATGTAVLPLRTPLSVPEQDAVTLFMPARVGDSLGAKIVSVFPRNVAHNLPMISGVVVMIDSETGAPAALLDANYLTALRTAAGSGAATEALALPGARTAAILGAGTLARTHLLAICAVRPLTDIRVYSRNPQHVAALIAEMQPQVEAHLIAATSSAEAVRDADIICCATTSSVPVMDGHDLKPGAHVNGVGSYTLQMQEVDSHTVQRAGQVFVDSRESVLAEAGDLVTPIKQGLLTESDLIEVGLVMAGQHPGRTSTEAITFFKSCGLAAQDVVAAGEAIRLAKELHLGTEINL
jgi:ornithine cyclodeaminase/alanine dehydrogenase-like protein (mu-crystallin family)